jgi:hypothetical protein
MAEREPGQNPLVRRSGHEAAENVAACGDGPEGVGLSGPKIPLFAKLPSFSII